MKIACSLDPSLKNTTEQHFVLEKHSKISGSIHALSVKIGYVYKQA